MSNLSVQLLGTPQIFVDDQPIQVDTRKAIALIAYLATAELIQRRSVLAAFLWPESDDSHARSALRRTLAALNKAIDGPWIEADRKTIELIPQPSLMVDVLEVRRLLKATRAAGEDCARAVPLLEEAIGHFRGTFMQGFTLYDSPEFDEWQRYQSEYWQQELSWAMEQLVDCHRKAGDYEAGIRQARQWLVLDDLHEPAHQALMMLYALSGNRTAAIRQYETCQTVLEEALGIEPQATTTDLYQRILKGDYEQASTPPAQLVQPQQEPETAVKPVRSIPRQTTSFIGRESEMDEIQQLLDTDGNRLVTIIGPGGIGKTRLSLEVAAAREGKYQHGVHFVSLGAVSAVDYLVPTIADALDFSFYSSSGSDPRLQLLNYLRQKEMLLIIDNFEHMIDGVDLIEDILHQAPGLQILVTSQERLNLLEEWLVEIYGLQCPGDREDIESCSAVQLFIQRASQVNRNFTADSDTNAHIARICHLVGGMPLGLELASTWTRILPCEAIADQIEESMDFLASNVRNIPDRHRSMRAVFEHSWRLLAEEERNAYRKLSVFRGGFTAEAAHQVADAALPTLLDLTNKSLLSSDRSGHFEIQEVLHQYARGKFREELPEDERQRVESRHSSHYLSLLKEKEMDLMGEGQSAALTEIGEAIENVRQAWQWAVNHQDFSAVNGAMESLYRFFEIRSWFQEGKTVFRQLVSALEEQDAPLLYLGRALSRWGRLQVRLSQMDEGKETLDRGLAILQQEGDKGEMAAVLSIIGVILEAMAEYEAAEERQKESLALYKEIGDRRGIASALLRLGNVAYTNGRYDDAQANYQESLTLRRQIGDNRGVALCLNNLGSLVETLGRYEEAFQMYEESVALKRKLGDRRGVAYTLNNLGHISCLRADYEAGRLYLNESRQIFKEIEDLRGLSFVVTNLGNVAFGLEDYSEAKEYYLESLAICQKVDYRFGAFYALNHLGETKIKLGEYEAAKGRFREALTLALSLDSLPLILSVLVDIAALMVAIAELEPARRLLTYVLNNASSRKESLNKAEQLWFQISSEPIQMGGNQMGQYESDQLNKITDFTMNWLDA